MISKIIKYDNMTNNKNKIYVLSIHYGDGDWYLYKSKSKERLIKFRDKMKRFGEGISYARVLRSKIKLMTKEELRELYSNGIVKYHYGEIR